MTRGPLFQNNCFEFADFNGQQLEKLISCEDPHSRDVIIVYIKVMDKEWHQYFLDVGYGFWQNYENIDPAHEENTELEYSYINKSSEWNLAGKIITRIFCAPDYNNCSITIEFNNNTTIVLKTTEPQIFDSDCELLFISSS